MLDFNDEAENDATPGPENTDGEGTSGNEAAETSASPEPRRPRARPAAAHVEIGTFGAVPINAKRWGMTRATASGDWETLKHGDGSVLHEDWPISELNDATVRARWGAGTYRVAWWTATPRGGRKFVCHGRTVTFEGGEPAPTSVHVPLPVSAPVASAAPSSLDEVLRIMGAIEAQAEQRRAVVDSQTNEKLMQLVTLAKTFNAPPPPPPAGPTFEQIQQLLREEREHTARIISEALGDDDDDDDDDSRSPIVDAARAAAAPMFRGKRTWWKDLGNFANEHPDVVKAVVPVVAGAAQTIAGVVASAVAAPPPRPRAVPQQLPHVQQVQTAPPPAPAPAPAPPPPAPVPIDDRNDPPVVSAVAS